MNEFLTMKCRLLAAPYHKLVPKDKDLVTKWKEQVFLVLNSHLC